MKEKRGRFTILEIDENDSFSNLKTRHMSISQRNLFHNSDVCFLLDDCFFLNEVYDYESNTWIKVDQIWNNLTHDIKNEKDNLDVLFKNVCSIDNCNGNSIPKESFTKCESIFYSSISDDESTTNALIELNI